MPQLYPHTHCLEMTPLLAQIPSAAPGSIETWLLAAAAIVAIANQGIGLFKNVKNSPQFIQLSEQFTTRSSFHKHAELNRLAHDRIESRVAALERKLEHDKDEIIAAGEERARLIHDRINVAIEKLGELRGEVNHIGKRGESH